MKKLPCPNCGTAKYPNGKPQTLGWVSSNPYVYKCFSCKKTLKVRASDIAMLPVMTEAEARAEGLLEGPPQDVPPFQEKRVTASALISPIAGVLTKPPSD